MQLGGPEWTYQCPGWSTMRISNKQPETDTSQSFNVPAFLFHRRPPPIVLSANSETPRYPKTKTLYKTKRAIQSNSVHLFKKIKNSCHFKAVIQKNLKYSSVVKKKEEENMWKMEICLSPDQFGKAVEWILNPLGRFSGRWIWYVYSHTHWKTETCRSNNPPFDRTMYYIAMEPLFRVLMGGRFLVCGSWMEF